MSQNNITPREELCYKLHLRLAASSNAKQYDYKAEIMCATVHASLSLMLMHCESSYSCELVSSCRPRAAVQYKHNNEHNKNTQNKIIKEHTDTVTYLIIQKAWLSPGNKHYSFSTEF